MSEKIDALLQELKSEIIKETEENKDIIKAIEDEKEKYRKILMKTLSSKIGEKIYWASKEWNNIETHTITGIEYSKVESNFWGSDYKNKLCIKIVCGDGYFLANNIGETLFFDENEAKKHSALKQ